MTADLPWPSSHSEAIAIQKRLVGQLILKGDLSGVDLVAGVDVSSFGNTGTMVGAVTLWSLNRGEVTQSTTATAEAALPYIPGLLAFREIPVLLEAFRKLQVRPEAVICDGQGTAHPRGFGIACHLGLYLGIPTVGCGKSRLIGSYTEPGNPKGSATDLTHRGRRIGQVVRTRTGVKPVFVSPGHLVGFDEAVELVLRACSRYRLPEPVRAAHKLANETRMELGRVTPATAGMKGKWNGLEDE